MCMCNITQQKMIPHTEILFMKVIHLKCSKLRYKTISSMIISWESSFTMNVIL